MRRTILIIALLFMAIPTFAASWKAEGPYFGNVLSIIVDPANAEHLWASTHGGGVWRSTDGGASWQISGALLSESVVPYVALQPKSSSVLFAGVENGAMARSKDGGKTWEWIADDLAQTPHPPAFDPTNPKSIWMPDVNLHKRSSDGGTKWTDFRISGGDVMTFTFHPSNSKIIWAGGVNGRSGLWKTIDGGASWRQIGKGLPESNRARQILVDSADPDTLYMVAFRGGYKSTDGGESWDPIGGSFPQEKEIRFLAMQPGSPKTLFASSAKGFIKSTDGGRSWAELENGLPNYIVSALAINPANPDQMWAGVSGAGIYRTTDGGKTWTGANTGLAASWIEKVWGDPTGTIFAQASLGLFRTDGKGGWIEVVEPFSHEKATVGTIVFDAKNPKMVHAGDSWQYFRSSDGGVKWTEIVKPFQDPKPVFSCLVPDAKNPKILYSADAHPSSDDPSIFKSTDGGVKWKPASKGVTGGILELRADSAGTLFALGDKGGLWRSTDGATTWTAGGGALPMEEMTGLAIDPNNPSAVYATTKKGFYRSEDGGVTFAAAKLGMKDATVEGAAVDAKGNVYAATHDGIVRSSDGGKSWTAFNDGFTNKDVRVLFSAGSRLYAGTAGGGVFSVEP